MDIAGLFSTVSDTVTLDSLFSLIFLMMGEELLKFVPLMILMRIIYRYSHNRKLSIIASDLIVMICSGLVHWAHSYSTLSQALFFPCFGTIFEMYGCIKTKKSFCTLFISLFNGFYHY